MKNRIRPSKKLISSVALVALCVQSVLAATYEYRQYKEGLTVVTEPRAESETGGQTPGLLEWSTQALNFSATRVGQRSASLGIAVFNTGGTAVFLGSPTVSGPFEVTHNCPGYLAPGQGCTYGVVFVPQTTGAVTGEVRISTEVGLRTIALNATGVDVGLQVDVGSVNFPATQVGQRSATQTIRVLNQGNIVAESLSVSISKDFEIQSTSCSPELAPGASCDILVSFAPTQSGARTGTLSIAAAGVAPLNVALSGLAAQASASVSATALSFDETVVGRSSAPKSVLVYNAGVGPLQLGSASISGPFVVSHNCPAQLLPGNSCAYSISFTPLAMGAAQGELVLDIEGERTVVALSGQAVQAILTLDAQVYDFSSVQRGQASEVRGITVANNGNIRATDVTVQATGPFTVVRNGCPATLEAGQSCTLDVRFGPTAASTYVASLNVTAGDGAQGDSAYLAGVGTERTFTGNIAFGNVEVGARQVATVVNINNNTSAWMQVGKPQLSGPFAALGAACENAFLAPGESCSLQVEFRPSTAGAYSTTYTLQSAFGEVTLSLSGTGTKAVLSITPTAVSFGPTSVGSSASVRVMLTNIGTATARDIAANISTAFGVSGSNCPANLAPGAACTFEVVFSPTQTRAYAGQLTVWASNADAVVLPLSGDGAFNWVFANTPINGTSASRSLNVTNPASTAVGFGSLTVSGPFVVTANTCSAGVPAGGACTVSVAFRPTATGPATGLMTLVLSTGTFYANLSGTGTP